MPDHLRILGQAALAATTLTDVYTVPATKSATISSVVVCNRGVATSFRISVAKAGLADTNKQYLYYDTAIAANDTFAATIGITMDTGDVLRVYGTSANCSASVFGVEVG
jgi:hypothetical protein